MEADTLPASPFTQPEAPLVTAVDAWTFVHLLLFVYWLGADLGVFMLARAAKRADLAYAQRAIVLHMALRVDVAPRLAFALMLPTGLELAASRGLVELPAWLQLLAWAVSATWVAIVVAMVRAEGRPEATRLKRANDALHAVLFFVVGSAGLAAVTGLAPVPQGWLAWKLMLFALIFPCGTMIDRRFAPVAPAFARLAAEGSTPGLERIIADAVDGAVRWVLLLYALVLAIAFLGTARPF